ncbi:MAG TPA: NAD-dependent epimerase/dehydratase family protein [Pyrinomonadaceae bacterium]|jgi:nucleoside-diphosphate-sugar epimerase|nr:NAD-dependent epimerase/dehydratase family protein [Pyrinomonadaceae bacterium]
MKILVTGGSGYLGTHVRRFFAADDFSRRSGHDILNDADVRLVANYDAVIHLAAYLDKDPVGAELSFQTNAEGAANVVKHLSPGAAFIYASTKDVYGASADSYAEVPETCSTDYSGQSALEWSKLIGERYVEYHARQRNIRTCIFRMSNVYARPSDGNDSGFVAHYVESVKRGWPIRLPLGGQVVRDILHVDDFSKACRAFLDSSHVYGLYNLGGGKDNAATLLKLVTTVGEMIQLEPKFANSDDVPHPVPVNYVSDLTRIREQLGWRPEIGIEEGLRSLL